MPSSEIAGFYGSSSSSFLREPSYSVALGAKVGIFWWIALGLVVSMFLLVEREGVFERRPGVGEWVVLLIWALFSLLSIWVVGKRPYLGLGIGVVGGVVLGYYAVESHLSKTTRNSYELQSSQGEYALERF